MLTVAVTGSNGFLGQQLVRGLRASGWSVVPICRDPESSDFWDITMPPSDEMEAKLREVDVMLHAAAYLPKNYADYGEAEKCAKINGLGTLNVLSMAKKANIKRFIYISSLNLLSAGEDGYIDNTSRYDCSYALAYFSSKVLAESYVKAFANSDMSKLIVRPSSLYSFTQPAQIMQYIRNCVSRPEPMQLFNRGLFAADYLLIDDFVDVLVAMSQSDLTGELNVGSGRVTSTYDFARIACEAAGLDHIHYIQYVEGNERTNSRGFGAAKISKELLDVGFRPLSAVEGFKKILS